MWLQDKERMCKGLRDLENVFLFVPCDSWRNSACDSVLCIVSRQCANIVMRCIGNSRAIQNDATHKLYLDNHYGLQWLNMFTWFHIICMTYPCHLYVWMRSWNNQIPSCCCESKNATPAFLFTPFHKKIAPLIVHFYFTREMWDLSWRDF